MIFGKMMWLILALSVFIYAWPNYAVTQFITSGDDVSLMCSLNGQLVAPHHGAENVVSSIEALYFRRQKPEVQSLQRLGLHSN